MANESKDQPVLGHIDGLVKEEERLYAQSALTDGDRDRLAEISSPVHAAALPGAGTSSGGVKPHSDYVRNQRPRKMGRVTGIDLNIKRR